MPPASPDGTRPPKSGRPSITDLTFTPKTAASPQRQKHPTGGASAGSGHNPALRDPQSPGNFCATKPAIFHQRVTLTTITTRKCVMEMRTPPWNGLHPRRSLYFVPKTNVERARNSSALPALIATYDVQLHKVLLRQPTDFRRQGKSP